MNLNDVRFLKGLKISHLNCRSILNKVNEILYTYRGIDILACSETWLNNAIPNIMLKIPDMDLYRYDRNNGIRNGIDKFPFGVLRVTYVKI